MKPRFHAHAPLFFPRIYTQVSWCGTLIFPNQSLYVLASLQLINSNNIAKQAMFLYKIFKQRNIRRSVGLSQI